MQYTNTEKDIETNHQKRNTLDCHVSTVCSYDDVGVMVFILSLMCGQSIPHTFLGISPLESLPTAP